MKYIPSPSIQAELVKAGLEQFCNGIDFADADWDAQREYFRSHPIHAQESEAEIDDRTGYFLIWRDHGVPQGSDKSAAAVDGLNAKRITVMHEALREMCREHFPKLREDFADVKTSSSVQANAAKALGAQMEKYIDGSKLFHLRTAIRLNDVREAINAGGLEQAKAINTLNGQVLDSWIRLSKFALWAFIAVISALLALVVMTAFSLRAHAQIDVIHVQEGGTDKAVFAAPFKLNFASGCTVTRSGSTASVTCSGAAANPGGSATQVQYNSAGTTFGGISTMTTDGTIVTAKVGSNWLFVDPTSPTKKFSFDASNITAGQTRTVNVPDANSTTVQALGASANTYVSGMSAQGVFSTASIPVTSVASRTGAVTLTSTDVGLANVTNDAQTKAAIVPNTAPSAGQLLVGNAGGTAYAPQSLSSDCTLASTGAITCTKTNTVAFAASATTDTTNAGNIGSGTLPAGRMPALTGAITTSAGAVATSPGKIDVLNASAFCSDAGASDDYACNLSPAISAYVTGTHYRFLANTANTGVATINFNSLGARTVKKAAGGITTDLADNDIRVGQWVDVIYDGTNMQMQSTLGNAGGGTGTVTSIATTSPITGGTITTTGTIACATCGVTGTGLGQFASTTSAQLATVLSDETGSGAAVFGTGPTIDNPSITTGLTLANAAPLQWKNSGGTAEQHLLFDGSNNFYVQGGASTQNILFQPNPGTTTAQFLAGTVLRASNNIPFQWLNHLGTARNIFLFDSSDVLYVQGDNTVKNISFQPLPGTTTAFMDDTGVFAKRISNTVISCNQYAGGDASVKINNCIADVVALGGGVADARGFTGSQNIGTAIWVGTGTTSCTSNQPVMLWLGYANFFQQAAVHVCQYSAIKGQPQATGIGTGNAKTVLAQSASQNLAAQVIIESSLDGLEDLTVDGTKASNPTGGVGVKVLGGRYFLNHVTVQNAPTHGAWIFSSGTTQTAAGGKLDRLTATSNGMDGIFLQGSNDTWDLPGSEHEGNGTTWTVTLSLCSAGPPAVCTATATVGTWSTDSSMLNSKIVLDQTTPSVCHVKTVTSTTVMTIDCNAGNASGVTMRSGWGTDIWDSGGYRVTATDFGGNNAGGLAIDGLSSGGNGAMTENVIGNQFGNNYGWDIYVNGWDPVNAGYGSIGHQFLGNQHINSTTRPQNKYSQYREIDGGQSVITGAYFNSGDTNTPKYCVEISETVASRAKVDNLGQNICINADNAHATGDYLILPIDNMDGNRAKNDALEILSPFVTFPTTSTAPAFQVKTQLSAPNDLPVLTCSNSGGSLAAATHFFKLIFNNTTAGQTTVSPEVSCATTGTTGSVVVTAPALPTNATGYTVYDSNTTNTELQQAASGACVNISANCTVTVLAAGAAVPGSNTASACPTAHTALAGDIYCTSSDGTVANSIEQHATQIGTPALLTGSTPPAATAGTAGFWAAAEGTAFTNVASTAGIYPDSTSHEYMAKTNGASTAGMLVRSQPSPVNLTGQTALKTTTTLCAASAGACNVAGQYRISWDFWGSGTACSAVTVGSVQLQLTWTDENAVAHTAIAMPMWDQKAGTLGLNFNFNTALGTEGASGSYVISTNGSVIQYATTYTACTTGTGTYNLRAAAERIQ